MLACVRYLRYVLRNNHLKHHNKDGSNLNINKYEKIDTTPSPKSNITPSTDAIIGEENFTSATEENAKLAMWMTGIVGVVILLAFIYWVSLIFSIAL